jgi:hypothetical protein
LSGVCIPVKYSEGYIDALDEDHRG